MTAPLVSVGIPTYNNPQGLSQALKCITEQTYKNIEIIVSDNASNNINVAKILSEFSTKDLRIKYFRQKNNIGPVENFKYVLKKAQGEYFMWAADDDLLDKKFIEMGVISLIDNPKYSSWFCTIETIDSYDRVIRKYKGFSRLTSGNNKCKSIIKYLLEPEILGKANIIYSIYNKQALDVVINEYSISETWGSDFCFNLAFLSRFDMLFCDLVLFKKRNVRVTDNEFSIDPIIIKYPSFHIFPLKESFNYIAGNVRAVSLLKYKYIVVFIMFYRFIISLRNYIYMISIKYIKKLVSITYGM